MEWINWTYVIIAYAAIGLRVFYVTFISAPIILGSMGMGGWKFQLTVCVVASILWPGFFSTPKAFFSVMFASNRIIKASVELQYGRRRR